jgi:hypothetical protein
MRYATSEKRSPWIFAKTLSEAVDAAERVEMVYEPLAAVARSRDAFGRGAPLVWGQQGVSL